MSARILVAGIGNIFLGDDAFGVEVAHRLLEGPLPDGVTVIDFGIRSFDLAYALMEAWDLVVLVDALPRGGEPGTLYLLEPNLEVESASPAMLDAHTMNPVSVLQLVRTLGGKPAKIRVVGCEPATVEPNAQGSFELSGAAATAVDEAVRMIHELIASTCMQANAA